MLQLIDIAQRVILEKRNLKQYDNLINRYNEAAQLIGRLAREIQQNNDIINNSVIFIDDLNNIYLKSALL